MRITPVVPVKNRTLSFAACLFLTAISLFLGLKPAFPAREKTIAQVTVEGNSRIAARAVLDRIKTAPGRLYSQATLNDDLERLNEWGPFSKIEFRVVETDPGTVEVTILVTERPLVNRVYFEGNREFDDDDLAEMISTSAGKTLDDARLTEDVEKLVAAYKKEGYLQIEVVPQTKEIAGTGEVTVFFNIEEGQEVRIREIKFSGAAQIPPDRLLDVMQTRARSPLGIIHSGILDPGEFSRDQERLVFFYRQEGYLDARLLGVDYEYSADGRWLDLIFKLEEGPLYRTGQVEIRGPERFPVAALLPLLTMTDGTVFSPLSLATDRRALSDYYQSRGYMDVEIRPQQVYNTRTERMDLTYLVKEGNISYIDRIEIEGNDITKDVVIRRELGVMPGEIFNGVKVRRSWERLNNLGFFESVSIDQVPSTEPGKKDLIVRVKEKKTGQFMFGFGYSSVDDFVGYAEIANSNIDILNPGNSFLGGGQKLRLRGELGTEMARYELSFTEPWLFGRPLSFGFDIYRRDRSWTYYNETRKGFDLRLRRALFGVVRGGLTYRLEQVDIHDVDTVNAFIDVQNEAGKNWISSLTASVSGDTRDSFLVPTRGMRNDLECELAGGPFGGDKDFVKTTYNFSFYRELWWEKWVLAFKFRAGTASTYGDTDILPVYERFYLGGGNTIRGFKYREVGPFYIPEGKTISDAEPIGGNSMAVGTVELTFPIIDMVRGAFFCDIGNVWVNDAWTENGVGYPDAVESSVFSQEWFETLNSGAGFGLRLYLPIGPIKLDYGYPLRTGPEGWNATGGRFHFNIGYEW